MGPVEFSYLLEDFIGRRRAELNGADVIRPLAVDLLLVIPDLRLGDVGTEKGQRNEGARKSGSSNEELRN